MKPNPAICSRQSDRMPSVSTRSPKWLAKAINDPKKLPILAAIPAVLFLVIGTITGLLDFTPDLSDGIAHHKFFSTWLVDMHFVPASIFMAAVFALGLKRFLAISIRTR